MIGIGELIELQREVERLEGKLRIATEALEWYSNLEWRPRVIQWWPFTRSDVLSRRASEAFVKLEKP